MNGKPTRTYDASEVAVGAFVVINGVLLTGAVSALVFGLWRWVLGGC